MTKAFYGCCAIYPTYGKDEEQLTDALAMFNMCLFDYTGEQIKQGFVAWMKGNKSFPTPMDIINLIERKGKPALDKSVYISLTKRKQEQPDFLTRDEWQYLADYEHYAIHGEFV